MEPSVTVIISKKDVDFPFVKQCEILDSTLPEGVKRIYVVNEHLSPDYLSYICDRCPNHLQSGQQYSLYDNNTPESSESLIIHHGSEFQSPYFWRKLATPFVETELTLFIFNDVFPLTITSTNDSDDDWIMKLVAAAKECPDYDVFQPWIWEAEGVAHNIWKSLGFVRLNNTFYVNHQYDLETRQKGMPETLGRVDQNAFLEDHCFMARTEFIRDHWQLDEKAAFTKEFRDMCLDINYKNGKILGCYDSHVIYCLENLQELRNVISLTEEDYQTGFSLSDILYESWRRSPGVCYKSFRYIEEKWGSIDKWDRINEKLLFPKLEHFFRNWLGQISTAPDQDHFKVMFSVLLGLGFDQFNLTTANRAAHYQGWAEFYNKLFGETVKGTGNSLVCAKRSILKNFQPDIYQGSNSARHKFVRSGEKYKVNSDFLGKVKRRMMQTLPPDTDLMVIQSEGNSQELMKELYERLSEHLTIDVFVLLVLETSTLCLIRISEDDFIKHSSQSMRAVLYSSQFNILYYSEKDDGLEFKFTLERIKAYSVLLNKPFTGKRPAKPTG